MTTPSAQTFRAGPHQHDALHDHGTTTLVLEPAGAALTPEAVRALADGLADRYEVLRTALVPSAAGGPPLQNVHPVRATDGEPSWTLRELPDGTGRLELAATTRILDAESLVLLSRELLTPGTEAPGPAEAPDGADAPLQYADIAEWLHELREDPEAQRLHALAAAAAERGAGDGQEALARLAPPGTEQGDVAGTATTTGTGAVVRTVELEAGAHPAQDAEALLLAAWLVVLRRFSGVSRIALRVRETLRSVDELRSSPGPLTTWTGFAQEVGADRTLADLVHSVRTVRSEQRENAELTASASAVRGPLGFGYLRVPAGLGIESVTPHGSGFGLALTAVHLGDTVALRLDGVRAADLGEALAHRLLDAVRAVLAEARRDGKTTVGRTPLGAAAAPLTAEPTPTATAWRERTVADLVAEAARRTPQAVALRSGNREVTYAALLGRAGDLAGRLKDLGAGPDRVVAVLTPEPVDRLTAQLGVLLSGAAYLVVDPNDPPARVRDVLEDSGALACLAPEGTQAPAPGGTVLCAVPSGRPEPAHATDPGAGPARPDDLAYLLYTSGTTGRPKPVAVTHRNVVNYLGWLVDTGIVTPRTALPATAAPVFDASLKQLWAPLVLGGTVLLPERGEQPAEMLAAAVAQGTADTVNTVPRLWSETLHGLEAAGSTGAAEGAGITVLLGGEALPAELVRRTARLLPGARVWNLYGPTETTANASAAQVTDPDRITLGTPVGGTSLHVLDEAMRPVPAGAVGELYAGGAGVARGYAGRGGLTADRFVPDPFSVVPGARLYRTGDLVRLGRDGLPEYRGRADGQLKVNGLRIEPGEIEAALLGHPAVRAAAADVREDRLVAWVVAGATGLPPLDELRTTAARVLPAALVPARFVPVDRIPLTANGKTDRAALPDPTGEPLTEPGDFVAPRTPVEEVVAEIWRTVLGVSRVGVHDGFFALGGDSIRVMRIVAHVRELMGVEIPLRDLLGAPTPAAQAELLLSHDQDGLVSDFAAAFAALDADDHTEEPQR
ncbi:amino acid adenylation domain-containing protein [Streptomyces sp. NPDC051815]|uniref:amino acid adenylation domain-containing protein n=1 Tax=Streptomyces sp. NPDC051815 TaxID=3365674 RepID=UPI0037B27D98